MSDHVVDTNVLLVASAAHPYSPFDETHVPIAEQRIVFDWLTAFRADDPNQMQIHGPIPLPLRFLSPSAVSNSWAALLQYHEEGAGILIVRLADGKKWEIPPRLPKHVSYVAGVRDNEVIAFEWTSTTVLQPSRILRYDLTQLEQFAVPLP